MAAVKTNHFTGGSNITEKSSGGRPTEDLAALLRQAIDDNIELRAQFIALLAKMDTDFTAQNIAVTSSQLDEDYESVLTPAALSLTKA